MGENKRIIKDEQLNIRINSGVSEMLKSICEEENIGKSAMIRKLIIDKYYDFERKKYENG